MLEWNLPPLRFSNLGFSSFFINYARTSFFSNILATNIDSKIYKRSLANIGAQVDFKFIIFFHLKMTFSVGYAMAFEKNLKPTDEIMFFFKNSLTYDRNSRKPLTSFYIFTGFNLFR
ncbi:MAG: hypothetical protein H6613_16880 [Ignavibacteriales bacterium]|nr:hypothetical protein [Ignavibacteriales bacterium]